MSEAEKRSVHTDALATLGSIIGDGEKRDAIHIAVEPAIAAARLKPGQDVGFVDGGFATTKNNVGIVDPFLKHDVREGERFWLLIYPRQITSLRHVWAHPDFPEAEYASEEVKSDKSISEEWLRNFCSEADCPGYDTVMKLIQSKSGVQLGDPEWYGDSYIDDECMHFSGLDAHGEIPNEFWDHVEIVLGEKVIDRPTYFSCSC